MIFVLLSVWVVQQIISIHLVHIITCKIIGLAVLLFSSCLSYCSFHQMIDPLFHDLFHVCGISAFLSFTRYNHFVLFTIHVQSYYWCCIALLSVHSLAMSFMHHIECLSISEQYCFSRFGLGANRVCARPHLVLLPSMLQFASHIYCSIRLVF